MAVTAGCAVGQVLAPRAELVDLGPPAARAAGVRGVRVGTTARRRARWTTASSPAPVIALRSTGTVGQRKRGHRRRRRGCGSPPTTSTPSGAFRSTVRSSARQSRPRPSCAFCPRSTPTWTAMSQCSSPRLPPAVSRLLEELRSFVDLTHRVGQAAPAGGPPGRSRWPGRSRRHVRRDQDQGRFEPQQPQAQEASEDRGLHEHTLGEAPPAIRRDRQHAPVRRLAGRGDDAH
jgi:hypothetical protein